MINTLNLWYFRFIINNCCLKFKRESERAFLAYHCGIGPICKLDLIRSWIWVFIKSKPSGIPNVIFGATTRHRFITNMKVLIRASTRERNIIPSHRRACVAITTVILPSTTFYWLIDPRFGHLIEKAKAITTTPSSKWVIIL